MSRKTRFKLLLGGKAKSVTVNGITVSVAPNTLFPLPVDVRVFEEDTHLILTVDPVMRYTEEHPIRLLNSLSREKVKKTGTVVFNSSSWYAVVHDLDSKQTCCREWVVSAYREIFRLAEERQVARIAIPLLGSVHGNMKPAESLQLMLAEVKAARARNPRQIMIIASPAQVASTKASLFKTVQ